MGRLCPYVLCSGEGQTLLWPLCGHPLTLVALGTLWGTRGRDHGVQPWTLGTGTGVGMGTMVVGPLGHRRPQQQVTHHGMATRDHPWS